MRGIKGGEVKRKRAGWWNGECREMKRAEKRELKVWRKKEREVDIGGNEKGKEEIERSE